MSPGASDGKERRCSSRGCPGTNVPSTGTHRRAAQEPRPQMRGRLPSGSACYWRPMTRRQERRLNAKRLLSKRFADAV
jgi:hypothetical protein